MVSIPAVAFATFLLLMTYNYSPFHDGDMQKKNITLNIMKIFEPGSHHILKLGIHLVLFLIPSMYSSIKGTSSFLGVQAKFRAPDRGRF